MPTADEHQRQADHNERFLLGIDEDEFCDWLATVAFYAALHLVEKLRAFENEHSLNHADRRQFVRARHPQIFVPYRQLHDTSRRMRYEIGPRLWLLPAHARDNLDEIKRYVATHGQATPPTP